MIIADLSAINGRTYPARRRTQNLVGGMSPIQATSFAMGNVTLEPNGGQVPWHNQEQEEIYFIVEGTGEMCLGEERIAVRGGQAVFIPATSPTGARNWTARCPARAWMSPRCLRGQVPNARRNPSRTDDRLLSSVRC